MKSSGLIPVFIISLPGQEDRSASVASQLDPTVFAVQSHYGVMGRTLPDAVCKVLTRDPNSKNAKGALGCFLSHVRVLEIVRHNEYPFALVLEDDVELENPERLQNCSFPDFDLVFCNDRVCPPSRELKPDQLTVENASMALQQIERNNRSVGADIYIVSASGADRILKRLEQDIYFGHIDVRFFAYCLNDKFLEDYVSQSSFCLELRNIRSVIRNKDPLQILRLNSSIGKHIGAEDSRRIIEDHLGRT